MKRFLHGHGIAALVALLFSGQSLSAQDAAANTAKNIAQMNCGAKIECIAPDGRAATLSAKDPDDENAAALITDDATLSYALAKGETTFIITFPGTSSLDRFSFVNENATAEGELTIAVSNYRLPASSPKWSTVNRSLAFTRKRLFAVSMVGVEARYLKLSFHVSKGGRIAALGLYGPESLHTFAERNAQVFRRPRGGVTADEGFMRVSNNHQGRFENEVNFNFANVYAKAHVVYVSSGPLLTAARMIDDDAATSFRFAASDLHPTTIIELAQRERLHRVSTLFKMETGRLQVYLLNQLKADPGDLSGAKLAASVIERNGDGKAAVNFDPEGTRYVALVWSPDSISGTQAFEVAEIKAFGEVPLAMLNLEVLPESFAMNMSSAAAAPTLPPEIPVLSQ